MKIKAIFKYIYQLIPFKLKIFTLIKLIFNPGKHIYKHLYFEGVFKVKISNTESFYIKHYGHELENDLFWKGIYDGWEKESIKWWIKLCRNSNIIFDVGANTGLYSLVAKSVNRKSEVHTFEPIPLVFKKLRENIILNDFDIKINELALSNYTGEATIFLPENNHVYSVTVNKNQNNLNTKVFEQKIQTITLSDYILNNKINKIDLIKIDVETHEFEVLQGMRELLFNMKPTLLIEIIDDQVAEKLNQLFQYSDYLFFDINETTGEIIKKEKLQRSSTFNYLICTKEVAKYLEII